MVFVPHGASQNRTCRNKDDRDWWTNFRFEDNEGRFTVHKHLPYALQSLLVITHVSSRRGLAYKQIKVPKKPDMPKTALSTALE